MAATTDQAAAIRIQDAIVEGITTAKYELEHGGTARARAILETTLRRAREGLIELCPPGTATDVEPGDLRRPGPVTFQA
jgi:hypothetical protein